MKLFTKSILAAFMGVALFSLPVIAFAGEPLVLTQDNSSGILYSYYTGTLNDGSVLCFTNNFYFCGAISEATSLSIPETVSYNGTEYTVSRFGSYYGVDFSNAISVTSLTFPASITSLDVAIPTTITDLHLLSEETISLSRYDKFIPASTVVWVPESAYASYQSLTLDSYSGWYGIEVHYEGWEPVTVTITTTPGQFATDLLNKVEQWSDVNTLIVKGSMNVDEMELFSRFSQLQKLDLSQTSITTIAGCHDMTRLQEVVLPASVTTINPSAFSGCTKLSDINLTNVTNVAGKAFYNCTSLTGVSLPIATEIGASAFYQSGLTSIILPKAKTIGGSAFYYCKSLQTANLPEAETIGSSAFSSTAITSISLPKAVNLESQVFYSCSALESVTLNSDITTIPSGLFMGCSSLTSFTFPSSLTTIGYQAFYGSGITEANLPEGLSEIGYGAFNSCSNLKTVYIPSTIQTINDNAFTDSYGSIIITDLYCYATVPPTTAAFANNAFMGTTLHVPAFSLTAYLLDNNWYRFAKTVGIEGAVNALNVTQDFNVNTYEGLGSKVKVDVGIDGHLTMNGGTALSIGAYSQKHGVETSYYSSYKTGTSTLITNDAITADDVTVSLTIYPRRWNFISFPFDVNVEDIEYPEGTLWVIRKYSGADRAALTGNTWQNMTDGMTLQAGEGYILHCAVEQDEYPVFVFHAVNNAKKNNIFAHEDVVKPLAKYAAAKAQNSNWNLVGNPYPSFYNTTSISHKGLITVWNGNGYTAYSLLDDDYQLRPHEAFFVQCPNTESSMTFMADGRTHSKNTTNSDDDDYYVRAQVSPVDNLRQVFNLTLSDDNYSDRARLVINPEAQTDYEISCDASKFFSDNIDVPQIFVYDSEIRYAIDERPIEEGIIDLGIRLGKEGIYTLSLAPNTSIYMPVMLRDNVTGRQVNLAEEELTFFGEPCNANKRFTLRIGDAVTGITTANANVNGQKPVIYDMSGRAATGNQKGIYIVNQNGTSRKVVK